MTWNSDMSAAPRDVKSHFIARRNRTESDLRAIAQIFSDLADEVKEGDLAAVERFFIDEDENGATRFERTFFIFHWRNEMADDIPPPPTEDHP